MLRLALGCAQRWFVRRLRWEVIRVNKIKNLFPKIFDFENLFDAYKAGIRGKRDRPDIMVYTENLEGNLIELQNEFIWKTYMSAPFENVDFRQNGVSFLTGQHTGVIQP